MIVFAGDKGILEIFWKHRINRSSSERAIAEFFSEFTHRPDVLALRHWLARQRCSEPVRNVSDAAVVNAVARGVWSKELVVLDHRVGMRQPGSGVIVRLRSGPVVLFARRRLRPARDLAHALKWLRAATDAQQTGSLRNMLSIYGRSGPHQGGDELALLAEKLLTSNQLVPIYCSYPGHDDAVVQEVPPAPSQAGKSSQDREEVVDAGTFGADHATAVQVAAMIAAAEAGIPFCEECSKAQSSGASS